MIQNLYFTATVGFIHVNTHSQSLTDLRTLPQCEHSQTFETFVDA